MALGESILGIVIKARDEASQTIDQVEGKVTGFGTKTKAAFGVAGAAAGGLAGAGLGVLGQRTLELDGAMAKLRAETGASAEETKALSSEVIDLSRSHLASQGAISGVMSDLVSLQGIQASDTEQIKQLTESYLDFATATGTDAAQNVAAFDDILDGFGLTAQDANGIMDKLVLSHQKFGTDVNGSTSALAKLAPTFKALNLDVDDGIGLLNMFAASGVDSAAASASMSKATAVLTDTSEAGKAAQTGMAEAFKLTAEQTKVFLDMDPAAKFEYLTTKITEIEDPAARAEAAMALFGAKGGAAMATALGNANEGLDGFKVKTEEASGAAAAAADEIEGTFQNRLKLLKEDVLGRAQDLTQDFGPALMGIGILGPQVAGLLGATTGALGAMGGGVKALGLIINTTLLTPPVGVLVAIIAVLVILALAFKNNWFDIQGKTEAFVGFMGDLLTGFKDGVIGAFTGVKDFISEHWPEILVLISGPFAPLVLLATDAFGIRSGLVNAFQNVKDKAGEIFNALPSAIKGGLNLAIQALNDFINRANSISFHIQLPGFLGGHSFHWDGFGIPNIPFLAQGGVVTSATLAMIGEKGPEAVIPLDRFGGFGGGLTVNVYVTQPLGNPRQIGEAVLVGLEFLKSRGAA